MPIEVREWDQPIVGTVTLREIVGRVRPVGGAPCPYRCDTCANYARGNDIADEMKYVAIAVNNCWGGRSKSEGEASSYERIGYHNGSECMIRAVIHSDCPVYAACDGPDGRIEWREVIE
jgi:hypothetical protein